MSRSRPRVDSRCSFQIETGSAWSNSEPPSRRRGPRRASRRQAKAQAIAQSSRASPGATTAGRTRLIRRSLLVTVPSFSPQVVAGSSRSAKAQVAVVANASCTTTNSQRSRARRTVAWSGIDWAGLVQAIQSALISPAAAASNISTAVLPGRAGTSATFQRAATSARCAALPRSRCADSRLAMPPTSRPPIAFGWPVRENGPAPGLPI